MAPDDTCKDPEKLSVEAGMILEFYDATGYHLRSAPDILLRGCETPYSKVFHEVMELVNDLEAI